MSQHCSEQLSLHLFSFAQGVLEACLQNSAVNCSRAAKLFARILSATLRGFNNASDALQVLVCLPPFSV